ncbi:hypothetical protein OJF2_07800 [Aquisphaera giovannonii]|uniref:Secreted protein n=1 Tax=Aquisphaera giovannonii TaxID=406548 RepID=A0A5B9VX79_9BACT|nr:hypothetical protein [Aquisphaera giovannonii]QEH32310.1 hypothetical protein OJF2_07800 [Aquisphaera giovannonii]
MPDVVLLLALILAHPATPATAPAGSARDLGGSGVLACGPSTDATGPRDVRAAGMARAASSGMLSAWDDEVEIPDEPEDDRPDDPGDALDPGRSRVEPAFSPAPSALVAGPSPLGATPVVRDATARGPCFVHLCRLLI